MKWRTLLRIAATAAALAAVVCVIFWRYLGLPLCFGVVVGDSMVPTLRTGDVVVGVRREPRVGDIAIYDAGGRLVVHRVTSVEGGLVVMTGDGCQCVDGPVEFGRVLCVVVFSASGLQVLAALVAVASVYPAYRMLKKLYSRKPRPSGQGGRSEEPLGERGCGIA